MNHYEELGVGPNASVEEIREAYRHLAKVLHPDIQLEPTQRRLAECQMKRLNAVMALLADPEQRAAYDASLQRLEVPESGRARWLRLEPVHRWPLTGLAALVLAVGLAAVAPLPSRQLAGKNGPPPTDCPVSVPPLAAPARPVKAPSSLAPQSRVGNPIPSNALSPRADLQAMVEPGGEILSRSPLAGVAFPIQPPSAVGTLPEVQGAFSREDGEGLKREPSLSGFWYYKPDGRVNPPQQELYPPEYIEAVIRQSGGTLQGRYRARYRVFDRAISPEVSFSFVGRVTEPQARLLWQDGRGGRGEVTLRLLSADSLELAWIATELTPDPGLASGKAVLMRRIER